MKNEFTLTIEYIRRRFHEYNEAYFNGELKEPAFTIDTVKSFLGQCQWKKDGNGVKKYTIRISDYYQMSERNYCETLLHEMIHLFIRQNGLKDTRTHHGAIFYKYANFLKDYGWDINRTMSVKGFDVRQDAKETYYLATFKLNGEKAFLMRYNAKYRDYYVRLFAKSPKWYQNPIWFTSDDSKEYASMTKCHTAVRGRYLTEKKYKEYVFMYGGYKVAV